MNKKKNLGTLITLLLIITTLLSMTGHATIIYEDTFNRADSGTIGNGWIEDNAGTGDSSISSNRLRHWDPNGVSNTRVYRQDITINKSKITNITWNVNIATLNAASLFGFNVFMGDVTQSQNYTRLAFQGTSPVNIRSYTYGDGVLINNSNSLATITKGGSVDITFYDINFTTNKFNIRINGTEFTNGSNGWTFYPPYNNTLWVSSGTSTNDDGNIYIDYIIIEETGENEIYIESNESNNYNINDSQYYHCRTNLPGTTYYIYRNENDTTEITTTDNNYTLLNTDFLDNISASCFVNTSTTYYGSEKVYSSKLIDKVINFNVYDWTNTLITSARIENYTYGINSTGNPVSFYLSQWANTENDIINTTTYTTDLLNFNQPSYTTHNISINLDEYNITLEPNTILLQFWSDGIAQTTLGVIVDNDKELNFNGTSLAVNQTNLTDGQVNIYFNYIDGQNFTQYYEYIKDGTGHTTENIEYLIYADWYSYFKVVDYSFRPIENALIRLEQQDTTNLNTWTDLLLVGQRVSDKQGMTKFYGDTDEEVAIHVLAEGYTPYRVSMKMGDESWEQNNPFIIQLEEGNNIVRNYSYAYIPETQCNTSLEPRITLVALGKTNIQYTTTYRENNGLGNVSITHLADDYQRYSWNLTSGTDYSTIIPADIQLKIYIDGELWTPYNITTHTQTIPYGEGCETGIWNDETNDEKVPRIIALITLLIFVIISQAIIKNTNIGIPAFFYGSIILATIKLTFIAIPCWAGIYWILTKMKLLISEQQ